MRLSGCFAATKSGKGEKANTITLKGYPKFDTNVARASMLGPVKGDAHEDWIDW